MFAGAVAAALMQAAPAAPSDPIRWPIFERAPESADVQRAHPEGARDGGVSGSAQMLCEVARDGRLKGCAVSEESPAGAGFGAALMGMTNLYKLAPVDRDLHPVAGRKVRVGRVFDLQPTVRPSIITLPDWWVRPTADDVAAVYPPGALARGINGRAAVFCSVAVTGELQGCEIREEQPAGEGFGAAVLALTPKVRMLPKTRDGLAIEGGEITIPFRFSAPPPRPVHAPEWLPPSGDASPLRYYPEAAQGKGLEGAATLNCIATGQGTLSDCRVQTETPAGEGFGEAALRMAPLFRMKPRDREGSVKGRPVTIPIRFKLPTGPDGA